MTALGLTSIVQVVTRTAWPRCDGGTVEVQLIGDAAMAALLGLLLSGCGQTADLTAEEPPSRPTDSPGVTVDDDGDNEGEKPTAFATQFWGIPGENLAAHLKPEDIDFWSLEWPGGRPEVSLTTATVADLRVDITDLDGTPLDGFQNLENMQADGNLAAGRYFVRVTARSLLFTKVEYRLVTDRAATSRQNTIGATAAGAG